MITKVKGTQDFLDTTLLSFFIEKLSKHIEKYNFEKIETPILEPTELFKRSLGLQTDVVTKEMYVLNTSKEEGSICLRPEVTASTTRAFLENNISTIPWKAYTYGPMFRHERPQKGRFRQFHQFNIEAIGVEEVLYDAYFISMLDRFFHEELKLESYTLHLNFLGTLQDRKNYYKKLDSFLETHKAKLCKTCIERKEKNIMRIFDCKSETCQEIYKDAPFIVDSLCEESKKEWDELKSQLELLSVSFSYTPQLVRGLDYYSKTVFEFASENLGSQSAICGGGRYDLAKELGSKEGYPSFGVAIGIERVLMLLEQIKDKLNLPQKKTLHAILPLSEKQQSLAILIADHMQANDLCADVLFGKASVKSMMRKTNKMGAAYALLVGEDEQKQNEVLIKNMATGEEERVAQASVVDYLKK